MGATGHPLTVVITRVVRAGREEAFEQAVYDWIPTAVASPGHLGVLMLRPPPGGHEYGAVLRFRSREAWERFRDSAAYRAFLAGVRPHLAAEPVVETAAGLGGWFTQPGSPAPAVWKMAIVTWVGVNLTTVALSYTLTPLTASWPWLLGLVTSNAAVVAALTWPVMPALNALLRRWLRQPPPTLRAEDTGT
jgi:antibiotic biosynthesis monooxygenase (ABM) superfamily enzyme